MKKQRELEELDELIARKKALIGLDDKPKADSGVPKERLGWGSEPLASDEEETLEWLPQNSARRQAAKPIKSILKKPKEYPPPEDSTQVSVCRFCLSLS